MRIYGRQGGQKETEGDRGRQRHKQKEIGRNSKETQALNTLSQTTYLHKFVSFFLFFLRYFETDADSFSEACARMEGREVDARWQAAMERYTPSKV